MSLGGGGSGIFLPPLQFGIFAPIYTAVSIAENAPCEPSGSVFKVEDAGF